MVPPLDREAALDGKMAKIERCPNWACFNERARCRLKRVVVAANLTRVLGRDVTDGTLRCSSERCHLKMRTAHKDNHPYLTLTTS